MAERKIPTVKPVSISKPENVKKNIKPIVQGSAMVKKEGFLSKVFSRANSELTEVNIAEEYIYPAIKNATWDIFNNFMDFINNYIHFVMFNEKVPTSNGRVPYSTISSRGWRSGGITTSNRFANDPMNDTASLHSPVGGNIILKSRLDAESLLGEMDATIAEYGIISMADMYGMAGLNCPYTYYKYGWTNIRAAKIVKTRQGWEVEMPKALPID